MGDNRNPFRLLTRRALIGGAVGVVASGVSPVVASGFSRTFGPPEGEPHVLDVAALAASPARIVPVDATVDVRRVDVTGNANEDQRAVYRVVRQIFNRVSK